MIPSSYLHIILTRFNLPSRGRELKLRQDTHWLEDRFYLFETICLPSVKAQTSQNFQWFIFFDKKTPDAYRLRAKRFAEEYKNITLFWLEHEGTSASIKRHIKKHADDGTQTLITTRLDNDDALNRHFIKSIQDIQPRLSQSERAIINFDDGITFFKGKTYKHTDTSNAFTSLIEPLSDNSDTIWKKQHTELHTLAELKNIKQPAMWLQVIHGRNVSNRKRGYRVSNQILTQNFTTSLPELPADNPLLMPLENIILYPVQRVKEWGRRKLKHAIQRISG